MSTIRRIIWGERDELNRIEEVEEKIERDLDKLIELEESEHVKLPASIKITFGQPTNQKGD